MAASSWLIRMKLGGSYDRTIIDGDEHPTARLAQPSRSCRIFRGVGRPAVGVAGGKDSLHESLDGSPIRTDDIADLHFGILTVVPGRLLPALDRFQSWIRTCPQRPLLRRRTLGSYPIRAVPDYLFASFALR